MHATLTRFCNGPMGTFGRIEVGERHWFTLERPWLNNAPMKSCVPLGEYKLVWQPTTTAVPENYEGHTWYLDGETVSPGWGSNDSRPRSRCCFHIGNTFRDVKGCIAMGKNLTSLSSLWSVGRSQAAMKEFREVFATEGATLSIRAAELG